MIIKEDFLDTHSCCLIIFTMLTCITVFIYTLSSISYASASEQITGAIAQKDNERSNNLANITILATGGTIAGKAASSTNLTEYKAGSISAEDLIAEIPHITKLANIKTEQISNIDSTDISLDIILKMAKRINILLQSKDCDGIVVTHGTDTLAETAYFLNLVVKSHKPVVIVGSMRPSTAISADGPLNLLNAVGVASSKDSYAKGVLIVLNGQIVCSREGVKTNTLSVETFKANELGVLGYVIDYKPSYYRISTRKHTKDTEFDITNVDKLPRVDIIYEYLDTSPKLYEAIVASKPDAIVIAATGNGTVSSVASKIFTKAQKEGMVIVRSSRTGSGIITDSYEDLQTHFIASDNLPSQKARILLSLALLKTKDPAIIGKMFKTY